MDKDFTPAQAQRWVAQEAAKHTTPDSIRERIKSERNFFKLLAEYGMANDHPVSAEAHRELVEILEAHLRDDLRQHEMLLDMPNGPQKKFYLIKAYGPALKQAGCRDDLKTLGCDQIIARLRDHKVIPS